MDTIMDLVDAHPQNESAEGFSFECGGGRIGVEACGERLTPYGGPGAWSHYLEKFGLLKDWE